MENSQKGDLRHWWKFYRLRFKIQDYNLTFSLSLYVFLLSHSFFHSEYVSRWSVYRALRWPSVWLSPIHLQANTHYLVFCWHTLTDTTARYLWLPFHQSLSVAFSGIPLGFELQLQHIAKYICTYSIQWFSVGFYGNVCLCPAECNLWLVICISGYQVCCLMCKQYLKSALF